MARLSIPPRTHIFVCRHERAAKHPRGSCGEFGSLDVLLEFVRETSRRRIQDRVLVTSCGCFGPCDAGPNVIMYPEGTLYSGVHPEDVSELIERHVLGGQVVERLAAQGW